MGIREEIDRKSERLQSIQAMMQEIDRILLRAALDDRGLSQDTKTKVMYMISRVRDEVAKL